MGSSLRKTVSPALVPDDIARSVMASVMAIPPIANDFTQVTPIQEQRQAHARAKAYLCEQLPRLGATVSFFRSTTAECPEYSSVSIEKNKLNPHIFKWELTHGVQHDIVRDGSKGRKEQRKRSNSGEEEKEKEEEEEEESIVLYGVASQFNGCESPGRYTVSPGEACEVYAHDHTQGPTAQMQFSPLQVEVINAAGNIGFNGLVHCLDEARRSAVQHGYFTPKQEDAPWIIEQLRSANGQAIEYCCVANRPVHPEQGCMLPRPVHLILVAAPAFGGYQHRSSAVTATQQKELEFLCAFRAFDAQFEACLSFLHASRPPQSTQAPTQAPTIAVKPTGIGLGVFGNHSLTVAKAFYAAALIFQSKLREDDAVSVRWQVFRGRGPAREVAEHLHLSSVS